MVTHTIINVKIVPMKKLRDRDLTPSIMEVLIKADSIDGIRRSALEHGYELSKNLAKRILYMKSLAASVENKDFPLQFLPFDMGETECSDPFEEE